MRAQMEHNQHLIDNQSFKTFKIDRSLAFIKIYTLSSILRFNLIKESFVIILSKIVLFNSKVILHRSSPQFISTIFARVWFDKLISSIKFLEIIIFVGFTISSTFLPIVISLFSSKLIIFKVILLKSNSTIFKLSFVLISFTLAIIISSFI